MPADDYITYKRHQGGKEFIKRDVTNVLKLYQFSTFDPVLVSRPSLDNFQAFFGSLWEPAACRVQCGRAGQ